MMLKDPKYLMFPGTLLLFFLSNLVIASSANLFVSSIIFLCTADPVFTYDR